jgi:hypothetical protein
MLPIQEKIELTAEDATAFLEIGVIWSMFSIPPSVHLLNHNEIYIGAIW